MHSDLWYNMLPSLTWNIIKMQCRKFVAYQGIGAGWECEDLLRNSSHASHCVLRSTVDGHFHPGTGSVSNGRPFSAALERVVPSRPWERGFISYLNTLLSAFRRRYFKCFLATLWLWLITSGVDKTPADPSAPHSKGPPKA